MKNFFKFKQVFFNENHNMKTIKVVFVFEFLIVKKQKKENFLFFGSLQSQKACFDLLITV
jgi:hypothetical protein